MVNTRIVSSQNDNTESTRETLPANKLARSVWNTRKTSIVIEFSSSTWRSLLTIKDNNMSTSEKQKQQERVLMINGLRKKHTKHQANHDVATLTRKIQSINFSSEDPWPQDWNPKDPLILTSCIRPKQIHRVYIDNDNSTDILYKHYI